MELDEKGEDKLVGDRTTNRLRPIFSVAWDEFSEDQREQIDYDVLHYQDAKALARRASDRIRRGMLGVSKQAGDSLIGYVRCVV